MLRRCASIVFGLTRTPRPVWSVILSGYCTAMTRHALLSGLTALAVSLVAAPAAKADDASLFSAYNARQNDANAASDVYVRALKRNHKHPNDKTLRGIIRADRGINAVLTAIKGDLA